MKATNGEYLRQEYYESCLLYPSINQNPRYHFEHLFFVNGNGVDFIDGNPHRVVNFDRAIPWVDYYKEEKSWEELLSFWQDRIQEDECEDCFKRREETAKRLAVIKKEEYSADDVWDKCLDDVSHKVEMIQFDVKAKDFRSKEFWFSTFSLNSYWPHLMISDGFFKLQHLTENTEPFLLETAIALTEAYIEFYKTGYNPNDFQPILGMEWNAEDIENCLKTAEKDTAILEKELQRLKKLRDS
jgi:hypothetical protein